METQPVLSWAGIVAFVGGLLALLVTFGVPITDDQTKAVLAALVLGGPLVAALIARGKVTPVANPRDDSGNLLTADLSGISKRSTTSAYSDDSNSAHRLDDPGR